MAKPRAVPRQDLDSSPAGSLARRRVNKVVRSSAPVAPIPSVVSARHRIPVRRAVRNSVRSAVNSRFVIRAWIQTRLDVGQSKIVVRSSRSLRSRRKTRPG